MVLGKDWMFPRKNCTMKTTSFIATMLVAFVTFAATGTFTTFAQPSSGLPASGVSGWHGPRLMSDPAPAKVNIVVQPALLPAQNSPGCWEIIGQAQEEFIVGNWRQATTYTIITNGLIRWQDLVYGESAPTSWGTTLQWVTIVSSVDGTDCISLSMFRCNATSTGGALNSLYQPDGGYSAVVYGRKASGQRVTDGSPDQLVAKLVITVQMALFNGGATPAGLKEVEAHVGGWWNYTIRIEAKMTCDADTVGKAKVSTEGFPGATPHLKISKEGGVLLGSGDAERPYSIIWRPLAEGGAWTNVATPVYVGDSITPKPGIYTVAFWP